MGRLRDTALSSSRVRSPPVSVSIADITCLLSKQPWRGRQAGNSSFFLPTHICCKLGQSNQRTKRSAQGTPAKSLKVMKRGRSNGGMVSGDVEGNLDTCRRLLTPGKRKQQPKRADIQAACLAEGHNTLRGSIPSFFMREISVVRLISMRDAAPSGSPTRPFGT